MATKDKKQGRPERVYHKGYVRPAYVACAEYGSTMKQLAKLFGISEGLLYRWQREHQELRDAILKGREYFDTRRVEKALLKRALGFRFTETTREPTVELVAVNPGGKPITRPSENLVVTKKVSKLVVPDVKAIDKWLSLRDPDRWKEVKEMEITHYSLGEKIEKAQKRLAEIHAKEMLEDEQSEDQYSKTEEIHDSRESGD
jgi:hypothetical protein